MGIKICINCGKEINTEKDLFVLLGTYEDGNTIDERYFHMMCWRKYFEECARKKAKVVVDDMQERMMPIAKQVLGRLMG